MPRITLPDGSVRDYDQAVTVMAVAESIGSGLAKATLAGEVDGVLVDASQTMAEDASLKIITAKDEAGLEVIRHSTAHLMAQAVQRLFPGAQVTIGPVIEDGYFYDFAFERAFTPDDLVAIEKEMQTIVKENLVVTREVMSRDDAIALFEGMGETYKVEIIRDIPAGEQLSLYRQGDFVDLCRGPHVPSTGALRVFKLMRVAGAYWRGDSNNAMLQRIYGTAWGDKKALAAYLHRLEEAEKRDHRKLGRQMNLFHFQDEAPGMLFWHPAGWQINQVMRGYIRGIQRQGGYQEVNTPVLADLRLWEKSGHVEKFDDDMFQTQSENRDYAVKPMSCPLHVQIFNQGVKSYRDLPIRYAEFGHCHRNEPSGALHGMMRVRGMVQDDGHIFCTEDQIGGEVSAFIDQLYGAYEAFGFTDIMVKLSTRPEKRVGEERLWDKAEATLAAALDEKKLNWVYNPGEGAFYGPKIEFSLKDSLGRVWQCGTMQLDFSTPMRLEASYVAEDNTKKVPVMLHRAMFGTLERFLGILIEHYGTDGFPLWLAPTQVVILNIADRHAAYSKKVAQLLENEGIRVKMDLRNEKIGYKIREHTLSRVPLMLVVGDQEVETEQVTVRRLDGEIEGAVRVEAFIAATKARMHAHE